jgi:hypothetical protein
MLRVIERKGVAIVNTFVNTTAAALRTRSESPFVLPTSVSKSWQPRVFTPATAYGDNGSAPRISFLDTTHMAVVPTQLAGTGVRVATKQDRPPRGVPR